MYNHRKKLRYKLEVALEMYDSLTAESGPEEKEEACGNLERQPRILPYIYIHIYITSELVSGRRRANLFKWVV